MESMWESEGPLRLGGQLGGWGLIGCITIVMRLSSIMLLGCQGLRSLGREGEGAQGLGELISLNYANYCTLQDIVYSNVSYRGM